MGKPSGNLARRRAPANALTVDQFRASQLEALGITADHVRQAVQVFLDDLVGLDPDAKRAAAREVLKLAGSYPSRTTSAPVEQGGSTIINLAVFAPPQHPDGTLGQAKVVQVPVTVEVTPGSTQ